VAPPTPETPREETFIIIAARPGGKNGCQACRSSLKRGAMHPVPQALAGLFDLEKRW
jgi:hypothetical protein